MGLPAQDATLAEVLKTQGYATGRLKNHLGDRNEHLSPCTGSTASSATCTGYRRLRTIPGSTIGRCGVLHTWATNTVDETVDLRFGKIGKQRIEDTGPLTRKRMETVDEEFIRAGLEFTCDQTPRH